jgi:hypothetical protein
MKKFPSLSTGLVLVVLVAQLGWNTGQAQNTKKQKDSINQAAVKGWIESQHYKFVAQTALPVAGNNRQLTSEYSLQVDPAEIDSWLPYFGKAYSAPMDPSNAGIKFKSKKFEYKIENTSKGGWDISINPKDVVKDVFQLNLHVGKSGNATLSVSSNSRQPISFNGYITTYK